MSCGSPLGDLFYLADTLLYSQSRLTAPLPLSPVSEKGERRVQGEGLRAQLYQMYGEGQINEEVFTALRALADQGQLRSADLAVHRARGQRHSHQHDDPAVTHAWHAIRSRLAQLTEARAGSEKVLSDLETRLTELEERIVGKEQSARDALAVKQDERVARSRLSEKAELTHSRQRLVEQAQALRADLARLDDLRTQLEAKAVELAAIQARSRLAEEVLK